MRSPIKLINVCFAAIAATSIGSSTLRLDPHSYMGPSEGEPAQQMVGLFQLHSKDPGRELRLHLEVETQGRRDISIDLDRAWIRTQLTMDVDGSAFTWGRVHPLDLSQHPDAQMPWSLLAQRFPQNRGLLLGYGYDPKSLSPNPIVMGWLGAHFWSGKGAFSWGVSATPLFVPSLGSETARFGRRSPGFIELNGVNYPLHFAIDQNRILEDVLLQPQLMAHSRWAVSNQYEIWSNVSRNPSPNPAFREDGYLKVSDTAIQGYATVRPYFPQRLDASLTQRWRPTGLPAHAALVHSFYWSDDSTCGTEIGLQSDYLQTSILHEFSQSSGRYPDRLLQIDGQLPIGGFTLSSGLKLHLGQGDTWIRAGTRYQISRNASVELGCDLFAGDSGTYFGEWRANDRAYVALQLVDL